jgi:hypothetical protein
MYVKLLRLVERERTPDSNTQPGAKPKDRTHQFPDAQQPIGRKIYSSFPTLARNRVLSGGCPAGESSMARPEWPSIRASNTAQLDATLRPLAA